MPRKHHKKYKKQYCSKKESVTEGFQRLEMQTKECKTREFLIKDDKLRKKYLHQSASENSLKINTESLTHLCSRSEPCLHENNGVRGEQPFQRRKQKKLRFSHEVIVMCYHTNRPAVQCVEPLADEWDQQKRSYKHRSNRELSQPLF